MKLPKLPLPTWAVVLVVAVVLFIPGGILLALTIKRRAAFAGNYGGERTMKVDAVVIHTTEGTQASAESWFAMDHTPFGAGPSSAHYVIGKNGSITAMVPESRIAWHASDATVNGRSIGIECEGAAADPATWTPALLDSLVKISAKLVSQYGIPVTRGTPGFIAHSDVPYAAKNQGKVDPGPHFPWASFLDRVRASTTGVA